MRLYLLIGALILLGLLVGLPHAQEDGEAEVADDTGLITRFYPLHGIPLTDQDPRYGTSNLEQARGKILPFLHQLRMGERFYEYRTHGWYVGRNNGILELLDRSSLLSIVTQISHDRYYHDNNDTGAGFQIIGKPEEHARVQWILERLRAHYARRIHFTVFELPAPSTGGVVASDDLPALKLTARLLAARLVPPREVEFISAARSFDYTVAYEIPKATSPSVHAQIYGEFSTGKELALSAVPGADGSLLIRAAFADCRLREMRLFNGYPKAGVIEQPDYDLQIEESACRLKSGEGWIFGGRYLVQAELRGDLKLGWFEDGTFALISPDTLMTRYALDGVLTPGERDLRTALRGQLRTGFNSGSGSTEYHEWTDGVFPSEWMHRTAVRFEYGFRDIRVRQLGPFLALTWDHDEAPPRSIIDVAPPEVVAIHLRRWVVPADKALPAAIMEGNPGPADFEALGAPPYSRWIGQLERGKGESSTLTLKHYVVGFDVDLTDELSLDPMGGIAVSGTRMTVDVGEVAASGVDVGVLISFGTPAVIQPSDAVIKGHGVLQTATLKTSAVELKGRMKVGDTLSAVTPDIGDESRVIVIAATRVEP